MFRHVRRIAARRRILAQRFRHGADVVRSGAATDALVVHSQRQCLPCELGDLVAIARQAIQRRGKGAIRDAVAVRVRQRLEVDRFGRGPIGDWKRRQRTLDLPRDLFQHRQHRPGTPDAVQSDHIRARVPEPAAGIGNRIVVPQALAVHRQRDHRDCAGLPNDLQGQQGLLAEGERLANDEIDAGFRRPAHLLLEHGAGFLLALGVVGQEHVGVADVARHQCVTLRRDILRELQRAAVDFLQVALAPDDSELVAVRVVGERLDHVGSGVHELPVQLGDGMGMVQHHLRHVGPGLHVSPAFHFEDIPLGADHRALFEALNK